MPKLKDARSTEDQRAFLGLGKLVIGDDENSGNINFQ